MRWHQSRIGIFSTAKTYCGNLVHSSPVRSTPSNRAIPARGMATSSSAYIDADLEVAGSKSGVLSGLTFAVKDMYDVRGQKIGFGNPTWRETHAAATEHSVSVQALLDAGASLKGRTHMDELAYSLNGENMHYGTPTNPACPDRIPGGSSSGSAVATADGDVDFALGSDTGGSVRVPASYCGVLGIRPSHGRASLDGACPLAPSFDTCGWFARDPETLGKVGRVLLQGTRPTSQFKFGRLLVGEDAFSLADKETAMSLFQRVKPHKEALESAFGNMQEVSILGGAVEGISTFQDWFHTFRIVQGAEAWKALGGWISEAKPQFGPGIKERFQAASKLQPGQVEEMEGKRELHPIGRHHPTCSARSSPFSASPSSGA